MLTKTKLPSAYSVKEHWVADSNTELVEELEKMKRAYPTEGYGTALINFTYDNNTGKSHADFYRANSCD